MRHACHDMQRLAWGVVAGPALSPSGLSKTSSKHAHACTRAVGPVVSENGRRIRRLLGGGGKGGGEERTEKIEDARLAAQAGCRCVWVCVSECVVCVCVPPSHPQPTRCGNRLVDYG